MAQAVHDNSRARLGGSCCCCNGLATTRDLLTAFWQERLEHDECRDLWDPRAKSPSPSEGPEFREALEWWQGHDGPEVRTAEREVFDELRKSVMLPLGNSGTLAVAPPHVQEKYAASASAVPGPVLCVCCV
jgi:hypothetical protein